MPTPTRLRSAARSRAGGACSGDRPIGEMSTSFAENLAGVKTRIDAACRGSGRRADSVRILPVTKKIGPDVVSEAAAAGVTAFGESRVQEARQKIPMCPGHLQWHMIGHLQGNKVKEAARLFVMIHSVDSLRLLEALNAACEDAGRRMPVCIEVNVAGDSSKYGVGEQDLPALLAAGQGLMRVEIVGLMTIPPFTEDPEGARPHFRRLRELRDRMRTETDLVLDELSMGMSHDFEVAVEEGATWIRLGSVLFGRREE